MPGIPDSQRPSRTASLPGQAPPDAGGGDPGVPLSLKPRPPAAGLGLKDFGRQGHLQAGQNNSRTIPGASRASLQLSGAGNHGIVWDVKGLSSSSSPSPRQGRLPPDQVAESHIQPGLGCSWEWDSHRLSKERLPGVFHPHWEEIIPYLFQINRF